MALTSTEEALVRQLLDQQAAILSLAGNEATITSKLGATKVTLADLTSASSVNDTDLLLLRQGTTDKNVVASVLRNSLSQFTQQGTDALSRSYEDKFREYVSVTDFEGCDPTGVTNSSAAFLRALNTGKPVFIPAGTYKVTSPVVKTGEVHIFGEGPASRILSDGLVFDIRSGSNSTIDNLYMENITAPWIITRDVSNWGAVPVPVQSNGDGYQPTANDSDIWSSLSPEQQAQNIGPQITFTQNAENIRVSRIYGRFVSIIVADSRRSTVCDCDFRAGKNFAAGIVFWNVDAQSGNMNKAINNHVKYASFCGITFAGNYDGMMQGNQIEYCGESGLKTYQGLVSGADARCYNMIIADNFTKYNFFDGIDISSEQPLSPTVDTRYLVSGNNTFGNRMTGFVGDGRNNHVIGNRARFNGLDGFLLDISYSLFEGNYAQDNNQFSFVSGHHEMNITGEANGIIGNFIQADASKTGYAIYAPGNANFIAYNRSLTTNFFFGGFGTSTATIIGNSDPSTSGIRMGDRAMVRQTAVDVPAQTLYNETSSFDTVDQVFHVRKNVLPNPIARVRGQLSYGAGGVENGWLEGYAAQGGALVPAWRAQTDNALPGKAWLTIYAPNALPSASWLDNGTVAMALDEAANKLKFIVKYSDGTKKSGEIALV